MNWAALSYAALALALLALLVGDGWGAWRHRPHKGLRWYRLHPAGRDVANEAAALAFHGGGRGLRLWIVRGGVEPGSPPDLYLGVWAANPDRIAEQLAGAANCFTTDEHPLLLAPPRSGWRVSRVVPRGVDGDGAAPASPEPGHDAARHLYADHATDSLAPGDVAVLHVRPHKAYAGMSDAVMLTTSNRLAESWAATAGDIQTGRCLECATMMLRAGAGLLVVAGVWAGWYGGSLTAIAAGTVLAAVALRSLLKEARRPRFQKRIAAAGDFRPSRHYGQPIPPSQIANWMSAGSRVTQTAPRTAAPETVIVQADADVPAGAVVLGKDPRGAQVILRAGDRKYGVFVQGSPGSGKTTLLLCAASEDIRARMGGAPRAVLWIETKGEGAQRFEGVAEACAAPPIRINALTPAGSDRRLELVDWQAPSSSAHALTSAFVYAFGDAIQDHSRDVLAGALECACSMGSDAAEALGWQHGKPNVIRVAFWLLGGDASLGAPEKARQIAQQACPDAWPLLYTHLPRPGVSKAESEKRVNAPRNKLRAMLAARGIFEPDGRRPVTLDDLLSHHQIVLFDLSPDIKASAGNGADYGSTEAAGLASILMFSLGEAIKQRCGDWTAEGRAVAIYSDELGTIAGFGEGSASVIEDLADQGRSRGVWAMFATQDPAQIPSSARRGVTAFGSHVVYRMRQAAAAEIAAAQIAHTDDGFTAEAIQHLNNGDGIAVLSVDATPQQPFVLRAPLVA